MKNSKFKKALSDELRHEYESFYSCGEEHIFSPQFEEEMEKLINGKKRRQRFFAVPQRRLALKYSLSACTALALCAGVFTIWHNHIKDNISDMEDMVVPPTTETTLSLPEITDAVSGGIPVMTDTTEADTKITQDNIETVQTLPNTATYPTTVVTAPVIGPPVKPVITKPVVIVPKDPKSTKTTTAPQITKIGQTTRPTYIDPLPNTENITAVSTGISLSQKHPTTSLVSVTGKIKTTASTHGFPSSGPVGPVETSADSYHPTPTVTASPISGEPEIVLPTNPVASMPAVTHSPGGAAPVTQETVIVTQNVPVTECVNPTEVLHPVESICTAETQANTAVLPHIGHKNVSLGGVKYGFNEYLTKYQYENYRYERSETLSLPLDNGGTESAIVHYITSYDTGKRYLAIHFLSSDTYCFYSEVN